MSFVQTDVLVLGAGAAGLLCAIEAGKRGRRVIVLDHGRKPAEKIRISGGGRCNFTNLHTAPDNYLSQNPYFCVSALARYSPQQFIALVEKHKIAYHEKARGQLFCDRSSQQIVDMLLDECRKAQVQLQLQTTVEQVSKTDTGFHVQSATGGFICESLVIACGGLSIPKMGASNLGYRIARQFDLAVVATKPALVPFTLSEAQMKAWSELAGVSVEASVGCGKRQFRDGMIFTHRGLSGPAMLQISSYWNPPMQLRVNVVPAHDASQLLRAAKAAHPKREPLSILSTVLPKKLAQCIISQNLPQSDSRPMADFPDRQLDQLGLAINNWEFVPNGTEGYRTAEVTLGGVDTAELSSKTMASKKVANLYFVGEVVDVTGHLGGFNFQWAWASGYVAGLYA